MKNILLLAVGVSVATFGCNSETQEQPATETLIEQDFIAHVDPRIGSGAHGHVFVGANVPFGAVQLGPTNISEGWDWCSGYHDSDSTVIGFAHTHLSGTGIGDLGDVTVMPTTGELILNKGTKEDPESGYLSMISRKNEVLEPGFYRVKLDRYGIEAALTASERVGMHQYTFPAAEDAHIIFNLEEGIGWDTPTDTWIKQLNDSTIVGKRFSAGWAKNQHLFFAVQLSKPISDFEVYNADKLVDGKEGYGKNIKGVANFSTTDQETILMKVGISPLSYENAIDNITQEIPGWDFDMVKNAAQDKWNEALGKVKISAHNKETPAKFYTALYHTMIAPSLFNDHDGSYLGSDMKAYENPGFDNLTTFSLWDTYRAAHPLYTIIQPEKVNDMVKTMLAINDQQGFLPIWHLMGNETYTMVGYHAVPVIVDAYLKGLGDFDAERAFEAVKSSAMRDDRGINFVKERGYIPSDKEYGSVSMGLEYAIDDWAIAQMAKKLGKESDYENFMKRAANYKNYFDSSIGFMRPKLSNGEWKAPFDPLESIHEKGDYVEGNGWQYTWLVPQDPEGLIELLGGDEAFTKKLDTLFVVQGDMGAEASPDISGLIGQYAHGNEPGHHITYLYTYAGQQWKTAEKVRFILDSMYTVRPDGLSGNEDVGQMSAWYVFSSMGFYPANPASSAYVIGSPEVDQATIEVGEGKEFTMIAENNSPENIYIQSATLNGEPYSKTYITHSDIVKGGKLVLEMGNTPNKEWGAKSENRPHSQVY